MKSRYALSSYCVLAAFVLSAAVGCQKEGSAQKAGKQVDRALAKAGDRIDDALDKRRK